MEEYPDFHGDQPIDYVEHKHNKIINVKFENVNIKDCQNKSSKCLCRGTCKDKLSEEL